MTHRHIASTFACALLAATLAACAKPAEKVDVAKVAETVKADVAQLNADFNAKDVEKAFGRRDGAKRQGSTAPTVPASRWRTSATRRASPRSGSTRRP